jgi:hypothetical protein
VAPSRTASLAVASSLALATTACGHPAGSGFPTASGDDSGSTTPSGDDGGGSPPSLTLDGSAHTSPPLGDGGCATATVAAKRRPAYLMFVQDGSDSMAEENKWAAVVPALQSIFGQMKTAADPGIAAGLILFPGGESATGPYPTAADVPLAFVSAAQAAALDGRFDAGLALGTPTEAALEGAYGELEAFQPKSPLDPGGKKIVVLITDGVPTDGCADLLGTGDSMNPCVQLAATKLSEAAPQGPIETFVIGVGDFPSTDSTQFDPAFLGNVAQSGGTGATGCNPNETASTSDLCYFEIDPSKSQTASQLQLQFETALDAIRGQVVSCSYPIEQSGSGKFDPSKVNVEVNGQTILQDPKNGWTYDNPTAPTEILLHGTACTGAMATVSAQVSIVLGCATLTVQ